MTNIERFQQAKRRLEATRHYLKYVSVGPDDIVSMGHVLDLGFRSRGYEPGIVPVAKFEISVNTGHADVAWEHLATAMSKYLPQIVKDAELLAAADVEHYRNKAKAEAREVLEGE